MLKLQSMFPARGDRKTMHSNSGCKPSSRVPCLFNDNIPRIDPCNYVANSALYLLNAPHGAVHYRALMSNASRLFFFVWLGRGKGGCRGRGWGGECTTKCVPVVWRIMNQRRLWHGSPRRRQPTVAQPMPMATATATSSCNSNHIRTSATVGGMQWRKMAAKWRALAVLSPLFCWYLHFHYNCVINRTARQISL